MKSRGIVLISTLIMILVVMSLALTGMQMSAVQLKTSHSFQDEMNAYTAAQSALNEARAWLLLQTSEPESFQTCASYPCLSVVDLNSDLSTKDATWWAAHSIPYSGSLVNITSPPRYIIEFVRQKNMNQGKGKGSGASETPVYFYRITARGTGHSDQTVNFLQMSVYREY